MIRRPPRSTQSRRRQRQMCIRDSSTVDWDAAGAADIVIEERDPEGLVTCGERSVGAERTGVYNPAFDITPADHIEGIITERGVLRRPYGESLKKLLR